MPDAEKEICLVTAFRRLEVIKLTKRPLPQIGEAQILEALELSKPDAQNYMALKARGVRSVSIGSASQAYDTSYDARTPEVFGVSLLSIRAYEIIRPYIARRAAII